MMKQYNMPLIEVLTIGTESDIITASSPAPASKLTRVASGDGNNWFVNP